ncbi:acyl-CoA thioesterase [Bacillus sp. Marseille-P3661]|uniref:acyl-CoA thioesterase n=1 Tax=Bacillus sp. Marseille-P3661 TaxID=1936234 RepID=UPI000C864645|nr:thioesterase family protein [Bacillus sp. Marseille-P3661]
MLITEEKIDVRYAETDQMGVVYHANYLIWFEIGRTKLIKELGFNYAEMEQDGIVSPVLDVKVSYKKAMHYGETGIVKTWIESYDGFRVVYGYEVINESGELAASGQTDHICVKKDSFRPIRISKLYPKWHDAYENAKKKGE